MCAYHHQSQHDGHLPKFARASVLAVRHLDVCNELRCTRCKRAFETVADFTQHWFTPNSSCASPFLPFPSDLAASRPQCTQVVQVYCHSCRAQFDRVVPLFRGGEGSAMASHNAVNTTRKRKRPTSDSMPTSSTDSVDTSQTRELAEWVDGFARFCINHAWLHLSFTACKLQIRVVRLDKSSIDTFPPYCSQSDRALMLFCMHECKRLLTYLEHLRTTRRSLQRRTKNDLKRLMALASAYDS